MKLVPKRDVRTRFPHTPCIATCIAGFRVRGEVGCCCWESWARSIVSVDGNGIMAGSGMEEGGRTGWKMSTFAGGGDCL
jgi:hypothetical protein